MANFNKIFVPRAPLATSNYHHKMIGSSQRYSSDPSELHRPWHEFMDDEQLKVKIEADITILRDFGKPQTERDQHFYLTLRDRYILPDLHYLVAIGRLPADIDVSALEAEFALT